MTPYRMLDWLLISILLLLLVFAMAPQQIQVLVFKMAQVAISGYIGYWFDRSVAPNVRPHCEKLTAQERAAAGLRRALIISAAMIAGALGA